MEVAEQQAGGVPDGWEVVTANAPSAGTWEDRGIGGKVWHPATGAKESNREDNSFLGMPPEFAALSSMAIGRAIGAAGLTAAGRAVAGLKATAAQVTPVLKYEATKSALMAAGVNPALATVAATIVAGYKKGAKAEPAIAAAEPVAAPSAPAAPVAPVGSAPAAPVPPIEVPSPQAAPAPPPVAPPASAAPVPNPAAPSPAGPLVIRRPVPEAPAAAMPDQRALNDAALAVHRAAYQRRLAAQASAQVSEMTPAGAAPAAAAPAANVKLSAVETKAFLDLMKRGMSGPDAMKNVLLQRSLVEQLGTPTPTGAATRFPKGMRGKPYQP